MHDVTELGALGERFDTVIDCGLLHTLADDATGLFVTGLAEVVVPGGRYHLLCMSDQQPGHVGPRRVSTDDIRAAFADGWRIASIEGAEFETTPADRRPRAWLATIVRA